MRTPELIAQLRHLYKNLMEGGVRDTASAKRIAAGLLGPVIEQLERKPEPVGPWKCGNEFLPYHPSASHVDPRYRDGWNNCYLAAQTGAALEAQERDAARLDWLETHFTRISGVYVMDDGTVQPLNIDCGEDSLGDGDTGRIRAAIDAALSAGGRGGK